MSKKYLLLITRMTKPFYKSDSATLFLGDSFNIVRELEPKSIDFIFADPPYFLSSGGISVHSGKMVSVDKGAWDTSKTIDEKLAFHLKWIQLCKEVLKDNGSIMISSTFHSLYAIGVALEKAGFSIINNIIWRKTNPAPNISCRCFTHSTETIIWARKILSKTRKGKYTFNYKLMKEENGGKQMKDYWDLSDASLIETATVPKREKAFGDHPTQKPLALMNRLILAATNSGDLVLDPFCGSSSTGVACLENGRRYVGIDEEKNFIVLSEARLKDLEKASLNKPSTFLKNSNKL